MNRLTRPLLVSMVLLAAVAAVADDEPVWMSALTSAEDKAMLAGLVDGDEERRKTAAERWEQERLAFWQKNPVKGFPPGPRDEMDPARPQNTYEERKARISKGLVLALQKGGPLIRVAACRSIGDLAPAFSNARGALGAAVDDEDAGVRAAAIRALMTLRPYEGGTHVAELVPRFVARILDADDDVRRAAIRAVGYLLDDYPYDERLERKALESLRKSTTATDAQVRAWAYDAIARIAPRERSSAETLRHGLDDKEAKVRESAAYGLLRVARYQNTADLQDAVPRLRELLADAEYDVRWAAARTLWAFTERTDGLLPVCREALERSEEWDLAAPCRLICRMGPEAVSVAPLLVRVVGKVPHSRHVTTGREPLEALYSVGAELSQVRADVLERMADPERDEREGALRALSALRASSEEMATVLGAYLNTETDAYLRGEALQMLARRAPDDPRTASRLRAGLDIEDKELLWLVVAVARAGVEVEGIVPRIVRLMQTTRYDSHRSLLYAALGDIGTAEAREVLVSRLDHATDADTVWAALARAGPRAAPHLDAVFARYAKKPQAAAAVLAGLGSGAGVALPRILPRLMKAEERTAVLLARAVRDAEGDAAPCLAALLRALESKAERTRVEAIEELAHWGPAAALALPRLREIRDSTGEFDDDGVAAAIAAFQVGGEQDAQKAFDRCLYGLQHSYPPQEQAIRGMAALGPRAAPAVPDLIKAARWWHGEFWKQPERTRAAVGALGAIGPGAAAALPLIRDLERNLLFEEAAAEAIGSITAARAQPAEGGEKPVK